MLILLISRYSSGQNVIPYSSCNATNNAMCTTGVSSKVQCPVGILREATPTPTSVGGTLAFVTNVNYRSYAVTVYMEASKK